MQPEMKHTTEQALAAYYSSVMPEGFEPARLAIRAQLEGLRAGGVPGIPSAAALEKAREALRAAAGVLTPFCDDREVALRVSRRVEAQVIEALSAITPQKDSQ
jgi:hypothetical protein